MKNLLTAFAKAQAEFSPVLKTATNPAFRSKYATLADVQDAIEPALAAHGLVVMQSVRTSFEASGPVIYVRADLYHIESGENTHIELGIMPVKLDPQGMGSAITYGRRYVLMTMFGLVGEDDDANAASGYKPQTQHKPTPPTSAPAAKPAAPTPVDGKPWEAWKTSADATAWATSTPAYDDADEAMRVFKAMYKVRVADAQNPTVAEKKAVFQAFYTQVMEELDK